MKRDLSELLNGKRSAVSFDYAFDPTQVAGDCAAMPDDVTIPENGIRVRGKAVDSFGTLMLRAEIDVTYETRCARCLDPVTREFSFDMERMVLTDRGAGRELSHLTEDGEWDGVTDDILYVNEGCVDADADIVEEVSLSVPTFDLCEPDCPGLCPKCGRKLRDGACECREEKYVNPSFAVLQTLLDKETQKED